ncbi:MAG: hypothetical protein IBV52_02950 [Candidatus Bathyarchaeota archaeon]
MSIYKRITDIECFENGIIEPEQKWYDAAEIVEKNHIDSVIDIDITVEIIWWAQGTRHTYDVTILDGTELVTIYDLSQGRVYLGLIPVGGHMIVTESYHMRAEVENWAQSDKIQFNVEYIGEQLNGQLRLENKDPSWKILSGDGIYGDLTYNVMGATFDYTFNGYGLATGTDYSLIYYPDPWQPDNLIVIESGSTGTGTTLTWSGSEDIGSIPIPADINPGAKIWLVLTAHVDAAAGTWIGGWSPGSYLFETALIEYTDTL